MPKTLGPRATLDSCKKDAKRWLKALRADDSQALARLRAVWPGAPAEPGLRDVQQALAREHGFTGWAAFKEALADRVLAAMAPDELAAIVLRGAWDDGDRAAAGRIALRHPELARQSLHAAAAFGDLAEVRRRLAADPAAATLKGGPRGWEPLQYLAYSRLPLPAVAENGLEIAALLLDHGADPNAAFDDGWGNAFKVLTGVIALGEGIRAPHPRDRELAELLVERGADPFDIQALYNTSIAGDDTYWLEFMWSRSAAQGSEDRWRRLGKVSLGGTERSTLDYLLGNAVGSDHLARAEWLLAHGADANGTNAYSKRPHHEVAQLHGFVQMAALLARHGARPVALSGHLAFHAACLRTDEAEARRLVRWRPWYLRDPSLLLIAAGLNRTDVLRLLLDLGMPVDLAAPKGQRALHSAAGAGALEAIRLMIEAGADIDRRGGDYNATPLGHGVFWKNQAVIDLIAPLSRDPHDLAWAGRAERLGTVLAETPALANALSPRGNPPLFSLPDDDEAAARTVEVLLAAGADRTARNTEGETAEQVARRRGLDEAADLLAGET
ncbi:MAG TPA: ankyrin repeat domain-containing protein [Croceibacterium sp.]